MAVVSWHWILKHFNIWCVVLKEESSEFYKTKFCFQKSYENTGM